MNINTAIATHLEKLEMLNLTVVGETCCGKRLCLIYGNIGVCYHNMSICYLWLYCTFLVHYYIAAAFYAVSSHCSSATGLESGHCVLDIGAYHITGHTGALCIKVN